MNLSDFFLLKDDINIKKNRINNNKIKNRKCISNNWYY